MDQNERIQKIFGQLQLEIRGKLMDSQLKEKDLQSKLEILQEKIFVAVKSNCKQHLDWLDQNATAVEQNEGRSYQAKPNSDIKQLETNIKELDKCFKRYQSGIERAIQVAQIDSSTANKIHDECIQSCIKNAESQPDNEVKGYIMSCFNQAINETFRIYETLDNKIENAFINLKKL